MGQYLVTGTSAVGYRYLVACTQRLVLIKGAPDTCVFGTGLLMFLKSKQTQLSHCQSTKGTPHMMCTHWQAELKP